MCRNKALVFLALVKIQEVSFCVSKNQQKSISATLNRMSMYNFEIFEFDYILQGI